MITLDDARAWLGIDYPDEVVDKNVKAALDAAVRKLHERVGEDVETYLPEDGLVNELLRFYVEDGYDARGTSAKQDTVRSLLIKDDEQLLRLALRRAKAAVEAGGES